jgi:hypothetical protein
MENNAVKCNICGGEEFDFGPNKRLSRTKKLPCCKSCGSAERHRVFRQVHQRLKELFRIFSKDGLLQLSVPQPMVINKTTDWGFPDSSKFGHYRMYGKDIKDKFELTMPEGMSYLKVISKDPVTEAADMCFIFLKSIGFAYCLKAYLSRYFECEIVHR